MDGWQRRLHWQDFQIDLLGLELLQPLLGGARDDATLDGLNHAGDSALHIGKLAVTPTGCDMAFILEAVPFGLILRDELGHEMRCHQRRSQAI
jgi:hypothetical protein